MGVELCGFVEGVLECAYGGDASHVLFITSHGLYRSRTNRTTMRHKFQICWMKRMCLLGQVCNLDLKRHTGTRQQKRVANVAVVAVVCLAFSFRLAEQTVELPSLTRQYYSVF